MARTRWPPGPVNPGLLPRPGRSDRQRRWVPEKPGARPAGRYQDSPSGVGRFGGQAGTQVSDLTPTPPQNHGSRAGSTTHILPAEYARPGVRSSASAGRYRMAGSGSRARCCLCRFGAAWSRSSARSRAVPRAAVNGLGLSFRRRGDGAGSRRPAAPRRSSRRARQGPPMG